MAAFCKSHLVRGEAEQAPTGAVSPMARSLRPLSGRLRETHSFHWYQREAIQSTRGRRTASVIELPCGSGKSVVCCGLVLDAIELGTGRIDVLVLCPNETAAQTMRTTLSRFTTIPDLQLVLVHSSTKDRPLPRDHAVWITTYSFLKEKAEDHDAVERTYTGDLTMRQMRCCMRTKISWERIIADEVHRTAAAHLKDLMEQLNYESSSCLHGLTGTFNRNDRQEIAVLKELFSEVTYEVSDALLVHEGFLAAVNCVHVIVPYDAPCRDAAARLNPHKATQLNGPSLVAIQRIVQRHKRHKILVFAQSLDALSLIGELLQVPIVWGEMSQALRSLHVHCFNKCDPELYHVLVCSEVFDEAIDMSVTVVIDAGSRFGSENQAKQRYGRMARPGLAEDGVSPKVGFFYMLDVEGSELSWTYPKKSHFITQKTGAVFVDERIDPEPADEPIIELSRQRIQKLVQAQKCKEEEEARLRVELSGPAPGSVCPLTGKPYVNPVRASDGFWYEKEAIEHRIFVLGQRHSPQTFKLFPDATLLPPSGKWPLSKRSRTCA
jgi:superfamily II DNA or RNA helicase